MVCVENKRIMKIKIKKKFKKSGQSNVIGKNENLPSLLYFKFDYIVILFIDKKKC